MLLVWTLLLHVMWKRVKGDPGAVKTQCGRLWLHTISSAPAASKEDKHLLVSWGGGGRAGTPELFCRSQVVRALPGLNQPWQIPLHFLAVGSLALAVACMDRGVLEANRALCVLCELSRVLESSWLHGEFTLPGLNCETACSCAVVGIIVLVLLIWICSFLVTAV